jgi:hypothetical protein
MYSLQSEAPPLTAGSPIDYAHPVDMAIVPHAHHRLVHRSHTAAGRVIRAAD